MAANRGGGEGGARVSVAFSAPMAAADHAIKGFLFPRMYRHPRVMRIREEARAGGAGPVRRFTTDPGAMPAEWSAGQDADEDASRVGSRTTSPA